MLPRRGRPLVVVVDPGPEASRGYLLAQVAAYADVWLFVSAPPTWQSGHAVGHTVVDPFDLDAVGAAARGLAATRRVDGVLGWDELKMHAVVEAARVLGLPTVGHDVVRRCRDKHLTRVALEAAGVPQPASRLAEDEPTARRYADELGYPVVLKPRALGASMGVSRVESSAGLEAAWRFAAGARVDDLPVVSTGVLVEECVEGPEISVDCLCQDGRAEPVFVARKQSSAPPFFEEVQHVVDAQDPLLQDPRLREVLTATHRALGYTVGVTHTELRLTSTGPRVIEVNCRIGGDLIPYAGFLASGVAIGELYAAVACGRPAAVLGARHVAAGVRFLYPPRRGRVQLVSLDEDQLPPGTARAVVDAQIGDLLAPPPAAGIDSRWAHYVVSAPDVSVVRQSLDRAERAFTLVLEPR